MKATFRTRITVVLLCFVMLAGLIPSTALAASPSTVSAFSISLKGAAVPVVGEPIMCVSSAVKSDDSRIRISGGTIIWHDTEGTAINESTMDTGMRFEAGRSYNATVVTEVVDPASYTVTKSTKVTLSTSGNFTSVATVSEVLNAYGGKTFATVNLSVKMNGSRTYPNIGRVVFADAPSPSVTDSGDATLYYNNCTKTSDEWYYGGSAVSSLSAGKTYTRKIVLTAKSGYKFSKPLTAVRTHSNQPKDATSVTFNSTYTVATLEYTYTIPGMNEINQIKVQLQNPDTVVTPYAGEKAAPLYSYMFGSYDGAPYQPTVSTIFWHTSSGRTMGENETFSNGETYYFQINFEVDSNKRDSYRFVKNATSSLTGSNYGLIGFVKAEPSDDKADNAHIAFKYYFKCRSDATVEVVDISVKKPTEGNTASSNVTNIPLGCEVQEVKWYEDGVLKNGSFKFLGDKTYRVSITLVAKKGTRLKNPLDEAYINNINVISPAAVNGDKTKGVILTVTFPKLPLIIDTVDIAVNPPVVGSGYDNYFWIYTSNTTKYASEWYIGDVPMSSFDTFQAGYTYKLKARLSTVKEFSSGVTVYVNNSPATVKTVDSNKKGLVFEISFTIPGNRSIDSVNLSLSEPTEGGAPVSGVIKTTEQYTASVIWSLSANGSALPDNYRFEAGRTYYADINLIANNPYVFADSTTVSVNGNRFTAVPTNGTSDKKHISVYDMTFDIPVNTFVLIYGDIKAEGNNDDVGYIQIYEKNASEPLLEILFDGNESAYSVNLEQGEYTFKAIKKDNITKTYEVNAELMPIKLDIILKSSEIKPQSDFPDVNYNDWYGASVEYAVGAGLMKGYANGKFGTADGIQRQDFVVILARLSGDNINAYKGKKAFKDVDPNAYYATALAWAKDKGVSNGYQDGSFGVGRKVTREQIMTFLHNYAKLKGCNVTVTNAEKAQIRAQYSDFVNVSSYAQEATYWALKNGVISGKQVNGKRYISPVSSAQRCEVAAMFYNINKKGIFAK